MSHSSSVIRRVLGASFKVVLVVSLVTLYSMTSVHGQTCMVGVQPNLTCIPNISTHASYPNTFFGLNSYGADPEYVSIPDQTETVYNPLTGFSGYRYPPGSTTVNFTVSDSCNNNATCTFDVINTLTELPYECNDFNMTAQTDPGSATFNYTYPTSYTFNEESPVVTYYFHGGSGNFNFSVPGYPQLGVGINTLTTLIYDDELNKTCLSYIIVEGVPTSTTMITTSDPTTPTMAMTSNSTTNMQGSSTITGQSAMITTSDPGSSEGLQGCALAKDEIILILGVILGVVSVFALVMLVVLVLYIRLRRSHAKLKRSLVRNPTQRYTALNLGSVVIDEGTDYKVQRSSNVPSSSACELDTYVNNDVDKSREGKGNSE